MASDRKTSAARADEIVAGMFTTAKQHKTTAHKVAEVGEQRAADARAGKPGRRKPPSTGEGEEAKPLKTQQARERAAKAVNATKEIAFDDLPIMNAPWMRIQEHVIDELEDPEGEHAYLQDALRLTNALTPGNLEAALNDAEDNARRAHKLYICARVDYERFELEMLPVVEAMRDAANRDLQGEKDRKERSKTITDADVRGRAAVLFPDEWHLVQERRIRAEALMDTLKHFAELWKTRCYSLSNMLHSGKRG